MHTKWLFNVNLHPMSLTHAQAAAATLEQPISETFSRQRQAYKGTAPYTYKQRLAKVMALEGWILQHKQAILAALAQDLVKHEVETTISEIAPVLSAIRHVKQKLHHWMRPKPVSGGLIAMGTRSYVLPEPKGVCLVISPWNYPFNLTLEPVVSALAAGNRVMIKPSELTPNTSALMAKMVAELYPAEEVAVFEGGVEVSTELLSLPFDHIFFTGSPQVGKVVMAAAAKHLSSVTLELGGKSPVIVDETANIKRTAQILAWGKTINGGQTCVAPDYLLVHEKVKAKLLEALKANLTAWYFNNGPQTKAEGLTHIVNERHFGRLSSAVQEAVAQGGKVVLGGYSDATDNYMAPTLVEEVPESCTLLQDEIFGPVLPIITYTHLNEALDFINQRPNPLALYLFTHSKANERAVMQGTSSGGMVVNNCVLQFSHPNLPFGGVNNSGIGKSHGQAGFMAFSHEKGVLRQSRLMPPNKLIFPPFTKTVHTMANIIAKYL